MFNKESIIRSFESMREIELSGRDFYLKMVEDPECKAHDFDKTFDKIATDEDNHAVIIDKIINIIKNNL